jgi:hypothetical protein
MGAMDAEMGTDVALLNPELLQIAEISPSAMKEKPHIVENLYAQWLSLTDTIKLVFFSFGLFSIEFHFSLIFALLSWLSDLFCNPEFNSNFVTVLSSFTKMVNQLF